MTDHGHKRKESDGHAASEQSPKKQRTETKEAKTDVRPVFALTVLTHLRQGGPVFPVARAATKEELGQITPAWSKFIGDVLFPADVIHNHVVELGAKINKDYTSDEVVLCMPVLKGAFIFAADLLRQFKFPYEIDFLNVSSYGAGTESSGTVTLLSPLRTPVKDRHVLIIEDLCDSGITLDWARKFVSEQKPKSLRVAVLLNKHGRRSPDLKITLDYVGADCPNHFIVGYGMDFAQQYRALPYIAVLKPAAYKKS